LPFPGACGFPCRTSVPPPAPIATSSRRTPPTPPCIRQRLTLASFLRFPLFFSSFLRLPAVMNRTESRPKLFHSIPSPPSLSSQLSPVLRDFAQFANLTFPPRLIGDPSARSADSPLRLRLSPLFSPLDFPHLPCLLFPLWPLLSFLETRNLWFPLHRLPIDRIFLIIGSSFICHYQVYSRFL